MWEGVMLLLILQNIKKVAIHTSVSSYGLIKLDCNIEYTLENIDQNYVSCLLIFELTCGLIYSLDKRGMHHALSSWHACVKHGSICSLFVGAVCFNKHRNRAARAVVFESNITHICIETHSFLFVWLVFEPQGRLSSPNKIFISRWSNSSPEFMKFMK